MNKIRKFKVNEIVIADLKDTLELGIVSRLLSEKECLVFFYTLNKSLKVEVRNLHKLKNSNKLEIAYKKEY